MYFSKIIAAVGATLLFTSANAGVIQQRSLTASQMVANINVITSMSQNLQIPANSINILSGPLFLIGQGPFPTILIGFAQIIQTVNGYIEQMQGTQPYSVMSDEEAVLNALITFVQVHQQLLNIIIGKAGILNDLPFVGPPVAAILRQLEAVVDTIAYGLIGVCPDVSDKLMGQKTSLDLTIDIAIENYSFAI